MKKNSIVVLLALMTCSVWAWAQEAPMTSETRSASQSSTKDNLWSVNESIGENVVGANGEDLGSVEDIVLDRGESRIAYVIVSYGGLLGVGDKQFAVPWTAFAQNEDRELSLKTDPDKLKNAPGFDKNTQPNTADPGFHQGVYSFYDTKPYSLRQREQARDDAQARQEQADDGAFDWDSWANREDDTKWARRLGELIGMDIENTQGDNIAELQDVIVESRDARAVYAVVSFGGTLGFFQDSVIIPWNSLRLDKEREAYVTDVTPAQLEQAKLSSEDYRNLEDRKYSAAMYNTFGTQPYWEEFGYENETDSRPRAAEARPENSGTSETRRSVVPTSY